MIASKDYLNYGITKKRFMEILDAAKAMPEKRLKAIIGAVDEVICDSLYRSIVEGISFDRLIDEDDTMLPASKSDFYRKRRLVFHLLDLDLRVKEGGVND